MKKTIAVVAMLSGLALAGCQSAPPPEPANPTAQKTTYSGMLPCADCSGIRTTLVLYRDQFANPTRFELREEYLKGSTVTLSAIERGDWDSTSKVRGTTEYRIFTINPQDPSGKRQYLKDAVNAIEMLDKDGKRIDSNLNYRLLKK
ncbi:MAG: copper resistance protein NlpE N-terminal domain-containing protein [Alcanivorax sp.]|nr:copper resistance protein NlpE N-terminal domain-containing protein [Alcanivorax sp.]